MLQSLSQKYGPYFPVAAQVTGNIQKHYLDGTMLHSMQPQDWNTLCPYIGPRIVILDGIKSFNQVPQQSDSPPKPAKAKADPTPAHSGASQPRNRPKCQNTICQNGIAPTAHGSMCQNTIAKPTKSVSPPEERPNGSLVVDMMSPVEEDPKPDSRAFSDMELDADRKPPEGGGPGKSPRSDGNNSDSPTMSNVVSDGFSEPSIEDSPANKKQEKVSRKESENVGDVKADLSGSESAPELHEFGLEVKPSFHGDFQATPPTVWLKTLTERSRFSNHPMIDTHWDPEPNAHWMRRLWDLSCHNLMRACFYGNIVRKFGLSPPHMPVCAWPSSGVPQKPGTHPKLGLWWHIAIVTGGY